MGTGEFLGGMALFGLAGAGALVVAWACVSRRLAHLDRLERAVAGGLVFVAAILAIHLVPLALGVLSRPAVAVAAVLAAAGALAIPRGRAVERAARPPAARDGRAARVLAWLVGGIAFVTVAAAVRAELPLLIGGLDMNTFHLPSAARWIETGSLWQTDVFVPRQAYGYYPNSGELLYVWAMLPFDNDFLIRWVIAPLLALLALAAYAVVRELGGSPALGALAATALVCVPIVGLATVSHGMPDVLLYAAMTSGLLFLLRHRRTGLRSDLVLAGLGLGIGFGTKWYGVSTAAIAIAVWAGARLVGDRGGRRAVLADAGLVAGLTALSGGIWLVRNLVQSGNPVFPVRVSVLGITIFDAPPDRVREVAGFSISDYFGEPDVLADRIAPELLEGAGLLAALALPLVLVAWAGARRSSARGPLLALGVAAVVIAVAYAFTPYSALGGEGRAELANVNTRYLMPALIAATVAGAAAAARSRALAPAVAVALALAALAGLPEAYGERLGAAEVAKVGLALAVLTALAALAWRVVRARPRLRELALAGAAVVAVAGVVGYAERTENRINHARFEGYGPVVHAVHRLSAERELDVGLAGLWSKAGTSPVWPSFGPRLRNHVEYVGYDDDGWLAAYAREADFAAAVRRAGYDLVVLGRGMVPRAHVPEQDWLERAGYVELGRDDRLILYASRELASDAGGRG